jgi:hypothetical protein
MLFAPSGLSVRSASNSGFDRSNVAALGQGYLLVRSRPRITRDGGQSLMAVPHVASITAPEMLPVVDVEIVVASSVPPVSVEQEAPAPTSAPAAVSSPEVGPATAPATTSTFTATIDTTARAPSPTSSSTSRTSSRTLTEVIDDRSPPASPLKQTASRSVDAPVQITSDGAGVSLLLAKATISSQAATSTSVQELDIQEPERFREERKAETGERSASRGPAHAPAVSTGAPSLFAAASSSPMPAPLVARPAAVATPATRPQPSTIAPNPIESASTASVPREHVGLVNYLRSQLAAGVPRVTLSQIGEHRKKNPTLYGKGTLTNVMTVAERAGIIVRSAGGCGGYVALAAAYKLSATQSSAPTPAIPAVASGSATVARASATVTAVRAAIPMIPVQYRGLVAFLRAHHQAGTELVTYTAVGEHRSKNSSQYGSQKLKKVLEAAQSAGIVSLHRAPGGSETVSLVAALR